MCGEPAGGAGDGDGDGDVDEALGLGTHGGRQSIGDHGGAREESEVPAEAQQSIHVVNNALPRFRSGWVPPGRTPGLEPTTVRKVHKMLHKALTDAAAWASSVRTWPIMRGRPR
jgi:hypothetical protein